MKTLILSLLFAILSLPSFAIAPVTGTLNVCTGATTTLGDATTGGTWSSGATATATIGSTGVVTGVSAGTAVITYTATAGFAIATVTVNATPMLSSTLTPAAICDSAIFNYMPASATGGTTFTWNRPFVLGIDVDSASGTGNVVETLYNTTNSRISVTYVYILSAGGCSDTQNVSVIVNPTPRLTSPLTAPAICDSAIFNYSPSSATFGATFSWYRPFLAGITAPDSGTGNLMAQIINSTNVPISVTFVYTSTAFGCTNVQNVTVTVNPTPTLTSPLIAPSICNNSVFNYLPESFTPGTTFSWNRPSVTGISPATGFGMGDIHELLTNTTGSPIFITYIFRSGVNGCINLSTQSVGVTVDTCSSLLAGNIATTLKGINIYPNPTTGEFTIDCQDGMIQVEVFNTLGEKVFSQKSANQNRLAISLANQPPGLYFVSATTGHGKYNSTILLSR